MSNAKEQTQEAKTGRIQVGNLPQQEKELKEREAERIKGGGGASGGVNVVSGEEIPQRNRS